jgi:hypothetical protein
MCDMDGNPTTEWLTYREAGQRLNVSPEAIRARAIRGRWRRQVGNDGLARIVLPTEMLRTSGQPQVNGRSTAALNATGQPRVNGQSTAVLSTPDQPPVNGRPPAGRLITLVATMTALRDHVATLKADNERLTGDLTGLRSDLIAERQRADGAIAELKTNIERLTIELAGERAARQADQEQHQEQLAAERTTRQADQEHAAARQADQEQQLAGGPCGGGQGDSRAGRACKATGRDRGKASFHRNRKAGPDPLRRSAVGRAWRWFLRN